MHFIIGLVAFLGLVAFAFGSDVARTVLRTMFLLFTVGICYAAYDLYFSYREQPKHYKVIEMNTKPVRELPTDRYMVPK